MYKHILIPTDGSQTAAKAVQAGLDYAREALARVTFFTAVPEYEAQGEGEILSRRLVSLAEHERLSREKAERVLAAAVQLAREAGVEWGMDFALSDRPHEAIVEAAQRNGCDAIFMATHGRRGLSALWHGSQTSAVLRSTPVPMMVVR